MKKLMIALACAASFAATAAPISTSDFNNVTTNATIHNSGVDTYWSQADGDPASVVKAYLDEGMDTYNGGVGSPTVTGIGANFLSLDTGGGELLRTLAFDNGTPTTVPVEDNAPVYIDTLVQFTATDPSTEVEIANDAKLAIWMVGDSESGYVLKVKAGDYDGNMTLSSAEFTLTNNVAGFSVAPNTWYRLTVKSVKDAMNQDLTGGVLYMPCFEIYLDGEPLQSVDGATLTGLSTLGAGMVQSCSQAFSDGKLFASLQAGTATTTLASVGFQGSGALDDFVVTADLPNFLNVTDFTLTWADVTAVSYTIGNGAAVAISGSSPLAIRAPVGSVVSLLVENADGAQKVLTGTVGTDAGIDATSVTFGWPEYLGEAVAGAYEIDDKAELVLFKKGVDAGLTTAGETF